MSAAASATASLYTSLPLNAVAQQDVVQSVGYGLCSTHCIATSIAHYSAVYVCVCTCVPLLELLPAACLPAAAVHSESLPVLRTQESSAQ
jgi:hypothetical protein